MKTIQELIDFGILVIDKPADWTSFDVVNYIRKALKLKKTGHLGTLDPMVTGVLPIVLEKACRVQRYFMRKDKVYIGTMHLHKDVDRKVLEKEMKKFIGKIIQLPPVKSAVKRQEREREVMEFKILKVNGKDVEFRAKVEAGTYIRKLVHDLGLSIGGAHMSALRRTHAGLFDEKDMITMDKFKEIVHEYRNGNEKPLKKHIIDLDPIIKKMIPVIKIKKEAVEKLKNGSPLFESMLEDYKDVDKIIKTDEPFILTSNNKIIEIAKHTKQFENEEIIAKPDVVFK